MRPLKKLAIAIVRPFYKALFERPLWWFLSKVKAYFFEEVNQRLSDLEERVRPGRINESTGSNERALVERLQGIEERLRHIDSGSAAQWDALEQLLLAMFRQSNGQADASMVLTLPSKPAPLDRAHAASNLR